VKGGKDKIKKNVKRQKKYFMGKSHLVQKIRHKAHFCTIFCNLKSDFEKIP
jgi:hypothetical protein